METLAWMVLGILILNVIRLILAINSTRIVYRAEKRADKYTIERIRLKNADIAEIRRIIDTEQPSSVARDIWSDVTKKYVESLELVVDGIIGDD